jgi:hypothetical protein
MRWFVDTVATFPSTCNFFRLRSEGDHKKEDKKDEEHSGLHR